MDQNPPPPLPPAPPPPGYGAPGPGARPGVVTAAAGVQVLGLKDRGRILGVVLASIGLVFQVLSIGRAAGSSIVGIGIDAFIIWALATNSRHFAPWRFIDPAVPTTGFPHVRFGTSHEQ